MDAALLLILLQFTNLRGRNIFLEGAGQLPGNWREVEEKNTMGAWYFPPAGCLLDSEETSSWEDKGKKQTNLNKSKIGKQEKMLKTESKSWEEAIQWTGSSGESGQDSQPPLPWCIEPTCLLGAFQLSHSGFDLPSVGQIISSPRVSRGKKNTFWNLYVTPGPAYTSVWCQAACLASWSLSFLLWKACRVASTVFHQI